METTAEAHPEQVSELAQEELLALIPEGLEPDAFLVIPIGLLSRRISTDFYAEYRDRRGNVQPGRLAMRLIRSLTQLGYVVNNRPGYLKADR